MGNNKETPNSTSSSQLRQLPGIACEECRARKLRCDRQRPTCSHCKTSGSECIRASTSLPRGPKKGHMRILQSKIMDLERRLSENETVRSQSVPQESEAQLEQNMQELVDTSPEPITSAPYFSPNSADQDMLVSEQFVRDFELSNMDYFMTETSPGIADPSFGFASASTVNTCDSGMGLSTSPLQPPFSTSMTKLMQNDLDQMYFDRVHIFVPMLHQKRYVVRSRLQTPANQPFASLRHAVWLMAASVCQPQNIQDMLYVQAKTSLDTLELNSYEGSEYQEEAQAWILLSMYEMKRVSFRKGWISAGRAIRLVHLMKLHEIDMPAGLNNSEPVTGTKPNNGESTWTVIEEQRRTFWMAYCLDRMVNLLNQVPFTISEQSILTRLPVSEDDFQTGRHTNTPFLFEVLRSTEKRKPSSFNCLLIIMTLWGRGLLCRHRRLLDRFYGNEGIEEDFCHSLQWLDSIIAQTGHILATHGSYDNNSLDSMLLFTNMVAHTMLISLCKTSKNGRRDSINNMSTSNVINGYEDGTSKAVTEMLTLCNALSHYGQSNIHPFAAIPLYFCADFLQSAPKPDASQTLQLEQILCSLRELAMSSVVAQTCVQLLDPSLLWANPIALH